MVSSKSINKSFYLCVLLEFHAGKEIQATIVLSLRKIDEHKSTIDPMRGGILILAVLLRLGHDNISHLNLKLFICFNFEITKSLMRLTFVPPIFSNSARKSSRDLSFAIEPTNSLVAGVDTFTTIFFKWIFQVCRDKVQIVPI